MLHSVQQNDQKSNECFAPRCCSYLLRAVVVIGTEKSYHHFCFNLQKSECEQKARDRPILLVSEGEIQLFWDPTSE